MLKRFVKFICVVLCIAMIVPGVGIFAEGEGDDFDQGIPPLIVNHSVPYVDVRKGAWYEYACVYANYHKYMVGTSETTFSPHIKMTREMAIASIIKCTMDRDFVVPNYTTMYFKDVEPGHWYSDYIQWGYENGLTAGIGDGRFGLGQPVTREEFLVMMYAVTAEKSDFVEVKYSKEDLEQAPPYAQRAFSAFKHTQYFIRYTGFFYTIPPLINGYPDGSYHLQDTLTRAQAVTILHYFVFYPKTLNGVRYSGF